MKLYCISLIALSVASTVSPTLARTLTVTSDGTGDFTTIQAAINASFSGDEIIVAPGIYTGTGDVVVNLQGKRIWLHSSAGPEETFIDGESIRSGIWCRNFETPSTLIQGFTIRNGMGAEILREDGQFETFGGGINCNRGSTPTITECIIRDNRALYGGGMHIQGDGLNGPVLNNCLFLDNFAGVGGGIRIVRSRADLTTCTFYNNIAVYGGGISNIQSSCRLTNCLLPSC